MPDYMAALGRSGALTNTWKDLLGTYKDIQTMKLQQQQFGLQQEQLGMEKQESAQRQALTAQTLKMGELQYNQAKQAEADAQRKKELGQRHWSLDMFKNQPFFNQLYPVAKEMGLIYSNTETGQESISGENWDYLQETLGKNPTLTKDVVNGRLAELAMQRKGLEQQTADPKIKEKDAQQVNEQLKNIDSEVGRWMEAAKQLDTQIVTQKEYEPQKFVDQSGNIFWVQPGQEIPQGARPYEKETQATSAYKVGQFIERDEGANKVTYQVTGFDANGIPTTKKVATSPRYKETKPGPAYESWEKTVDRRIKQKIQEYGLTDVEANAIATGDIASALASLTSGKRLTPAGAAKLKTEIQKLEQIREKGLSLIEQGKDPYSVWTTLKPEVIPKKETKAEDYIKKAITGAPKTK
jgi:predicted RNA-binding protein with PIN domain